MNLCSWAHNKYFSCAQPIGPIRPGPALAPRAAMAVDGACCLGVKYATSLGYSSIAKACDV